ncbi:MAG: NUMOD4 domain-containing protein [Clostridia bacterium]
MVEKWKNIIGFRKYSISNTGKVKNNITNKILKPRLKRTGYVEYALRKNNKAYYVLAHRLVAMHFIPNPYKFEMINHKDENKQNNFEDNLEWCDRIYNVNYGTATQRRIKNTDFKKRNQNPNFIAGTKKGRSILQYDLKNNFIKKYSTIKEAATQNKLFSANIWACAKGKAKTTGGYIWKYEKEE